MDDFVLFKFRPDVLTRIKNSKLGSLLAFTREYELSKKEVALIWAIEIISKLK